MKKAKMLKISKILLIILVFFVIGGAGSIFFDNYVLPRLAANPAFSDLGFVRKTNEQVTIINKTEQVTIKEDDSINSIASRAAAAVVSIVSTSENGISQSGSGMVVTGDGLIVTYRTAINEKMSSYNVFLANGTNYEAELVGIDEFTNLAYLKIDKDNLSTIDFANSNDFKAGKKLIAIGNSSGEYQNRFSIGLLSNVDKTFNLNGTSVSFSDKLEGVFESDFDKNKEYVGGPVVSYNGEVVGIMGNIVYDNEDRYFQIPSNIIRRSLDKAIAGSLENIPEFGLYYIPITKEYAITNSLDYDRGALVFSSSGFRSLAVISGSLADQADLRLGDVIVKVDGVEIDLDNPFSNMIYMKEIGEEVVLTIKRNSEELEKTITL